MGLDRDTSIVADAGEAGRILAVAGIANLESDGEITVAQMLLEAHRWVFDRLRRRFSAAALALLSNTDGLKLAVASRFAEVARIADSGDRDYWGNQAKELVDNFRPEFSDSSDSPRTSAEAIPAVGHLSEGLVFSGDLGAGFDFDHFSGDTPTER